MREKVKPARRLSTNAIFFSLSCSIMTVLPTAENGVRQNLDRALMLAHAFGYNSHPTPSEHSSHAEEPLHQLLIRNVVPFILFFVKLVAALAGLFVLSVTTYWFIYSGVIMRGLEVQSYPIFFDYSADDGRSAPLGRVDLHSTSHAPWVYSCDNNHASEHISESGHQFCIQENRIL